MVFRRPTVLILGAGTGVDFGLPMGKRLVNEISKSLAFGRDPNFGDPIPGQGDVDLFNAIRESSRQLDDFGVRLAACRQISEGAKYAPSIDEFVNIQRSQPFVSVCAKYAIAHIIANYERKVADKKHFISGGRVDYMDRHDGSNWIAQLLEILTTGYNAGDPIFANLRIINFNYDRCVEYLLYHLVQRVFCITAEDARSELTDLIVHPYGSLGPLEWQAGSPSPFGSKDFNIHRMVSSIRTFSESTDNESAIKAQIANYLRSAKRIVFLGFGFLDLNMKLLFEEGPQPADFLRVTGTVYGESDDSLSIISTLLNVHLKTAANQYPEISLAPLMSREFLVDFRRGLQQ